MGDRLGWSCNWIVLYQPFLIALFGTGRFSREFPIWRKFGQMQSPTTADTDSVFRLAKSFCAQALRDSVQDRMLMPCTDAMRASQI